MQQALHGSPNKEIKATLVYLSIFLVTSAICIVGLLLVFVVPKFQGIFQDMLKGAPLPRLTQFAINNANLIANSPVISGLLMVVVLGGIFFVSNKFGRRQS